VLPITKDLKMTNQSRSRKPKFTTKSAAVCKMLGRPKGASVAEMMATSGWQNHSVRAFLTGLRKKGENLVREERPSGETVYRIEKQVAAEQESVDVAAQ
jgi:hypothetical protein